MTSAQAARPDTVMGRALSARAVTLTQVLAPRTVVAAATDTIDLTTPEPPAIPGPIRRAAQEALERGETHYTTRTGVTELRETIARQMTDEGFPATADDMLITNGGSEALYIALQTLLSPGERVILAGATEPNVVEMIRFIGADPVWLPMLSGQGFAPSPEAIVAAGASSMLLFSPSSVTGLAIAAADLEAIIETADNHDMTVILDRSLATALYDPTLARIGNPALGAKVVTVGSFSMGHGLSGWRVGWLTAPAERMKRPRVLKQEMSICTTAVSQFAALAFLEQSAEWIFSRRDEFARRRDDVMAKLRDTRLVPVKPDAYPALLIDVRALDVNDRRFADRLRDETRVVVEPGSHFGPATAGFVRLDLGVPAATLREGIDRLALFAEQEGHG
jgi:aspartate/methionine/tyrosine aminotransferase